MVRVTVQHGAALISELRRLLDTEEAEATVLSKVQRTLVWNLFQAKFASNREAVRLKHMLQEEFGLYSDGFLMPLSKSQIETLYDRMSSHFAELHMMNDNRRLPDDND